MDDLLNLVKLHRDSKEGKIRRTSIPVIGVQPSSPTMTLKFASITEAARYFKLAPNTVKLYITRKKLVDNLWILQFERGEGTCTLPPSP